MKFNIGHLPSFHSSAIRFFVFIFTSYAFWTLYVWCAILLKWNFTELADNSWVFLVSLIISAKFAYSSPYFADNIPSSSVNKPPCLLPRAEHCLFLAMALFTASIILISGRENGSFTLPFILISCSAILLSLWSLNNETTNTVSPEKETSNPSDWGAYIVLVCIFILLYQLSATTNADDTHFLGTARSLLKYPEAVLFSQDPIFGIAGLKNYIFLLNTGQSWEALTAWISHTLHIDILVVYYQVLPILACLIIPLPAYLFLKRYFNTLALWAGIGISIALLLLWSTHNHNAGYFFIPRLYQGKSWLVTIIIPAIFWAVRRYALAPSPGTLLTIACLAISAGGLSSTGLYLAPIATGMAFLSFTNWNIPLLLRRGSTLLVTLIPNLAMMTYLYLGLSRIRTLPTAGIPDSQGNSNLSIYWSYGDWVQLALIIALSLLPFALLRYLPVKKEKRRELVKFLLIAILIGLNDPLSYWIADTFHVANIQWRWHWAYPIALILAIVGAGLTRILIQIRRESALDIKLGEGVIAPITVLTVLLFAAISWGGVKDKYAMEWKPLKLNQRALSASQTVIEKYPNSTVLADHHISEVLPLTEWRGRLISVRDVYWQFPYFTPGDTIDRALLQKLANRPAGWSAGDWLRIRKGIARYAIDLIILDPDSIDEKTLAGFASLQWRCGPDNGWYFCRRY